MVGVGERAPSMDGALAHGSSAPPRGMTVSGAAIVFTASAIDLPCAVRTSTCRNLATISSGLWRFLAISPSFQNGPQTNYRDGSLQGAQTSRPLREADFYRQTFFS